MTLRTSLRNLVARPELNFFLTNRIPRQSLTRFFGWFSRLRHPLIRDPSIAIWRLFTDLDLTDASKSRFDSLHDCFTRTLVAGARPVDSDPATLTSPSDGIVVACGRLDGTMAMQVKGSAYSLEELLADPSWASRYHNGCYVTLRLTSAMYHRFHAPLDCRVRRLDYIAGDCWNVNAATLNRVPRLYCRNERAVLRLSVGRDDACITLVPVAAVLVASMRFRFSDIHLFLRYRGATRIDCDVPMVKGQEMGHFEHGSTIVVLAPAGVQLCSGIEVGQPIRTGQPLMRLPV